MQIYELFREEKGFVITEDMHDFEETLSNSKFCLAPSEDG